MEELLNMPITLVIKAANQKIADQTIECALDWTVKKLKEHLALVYPNKPEETQQKIIYSGRLLQDEFTLKDVLRQFEPHQTTHTVHLVCAPTTSSHDVTAVKSSPQLSTYGQKGTSGLLSDSEGLRRRNGVPSSSADSVTTEDQPSSQANSQSSDGLATAAVAANSYQNPYTSYNSFMYQPTTASPTTFSTGAFQHFGSLPMSQQLFGSLPTATVQPFFSQMMMPGVGYGYDQILWQQQQQAMYAQYIQYMQLYQLSMQTQSNLDPANLQSTQPTLPAAPAPAAAARPANQGAGGVVRMNAQGGAVMDDDDDEPNRDWLDWVYTFIRCMMLMSILYFYSTALRFLVTIGFVILLYIYQAGWFRVNRRDQREGQAPQPVPPPADPAQPQQPVSEEANENEDVQSPQPVEPERPSTLTLAWTFFVAFFASLAPQDPPAVNAN